MLWLRGEGQVLEPFPESDRTMTTHLQEWILYTLGSALLGGATGYLFLWIWFFFSWMGLGYGDNGPAWINTVNDVVFWGGVIFAIAGGQILFIKSKKK